ncbi:formate--tetrahydrofolate ligase [Porphyromonas levii]|uniref:formate--tetrahydrofolate ligase n=1 Tax=Porphyromonas levii TaxID=28114 RepID=UPI000380A4FD|nr:formate--tetrahydrofolate ligase [Porphyromonas levii]MBR8702425.1 Formate--tetrahydrofolate ligase [Porphyromonas levii]MBR8713406.1 Formate--tetrahydrofolate ligase [Porphyromonas levii]MBR8715457.1 Formate--tetrahydrofolate ligase [Porphyromonas levii]MBR8727982.1 Formate--tetrahydrofolate ligase [Porphyromonas levii]MBR8736311.1 Formate--tetrahydrofolate ligase [Porphyromonas levii]
MKTDIQIARESELKKIDLIAEQAGIPEDKISPYGRYMAKVDSNLLKEEHQQGNLILVTAITPTKSGNGKTTVSIGLALGLNKIGKKAFVALREPSLGPVFGMKGGAAGGGYSQVLPMDQINLHFTGDFHAITTANNTLAALVDNYAYQNRNNENGLSSIVWKRVLDVNDRSLRNVITGLGGISNGIPREAGFDITPASEIMAILCLATDIEDLRRRLDNILVGYKKDGSAFTVKDLGVGGALTILLKDALDPNLVQTTENTPAFIHGGPFANIAHGCNSIMATKMALKYGEYAITEAGFGADLGGEKFFDIKCRHAKIQPKATVLVATAQALKMHGGGDEKNLKVEDMESLRRGFANLDRHVENLRMFGQSVIVSINRFPTDTDAEIAVIREHCEINRIPFAINTAFSEGGKGAEELARIVVDTVENNPSKPLEYLYDLDMSITDKVEAITKNVYRAKSVEYELKAKKAIKKLEEQGFDKYPVCIAKTQYSFTDNAKAYGAPSDFELTVQDVVVNTGAELIVVIMGSIMRMPGLPKEPAAMKMDIVDGIIEGLS